MSQATSPSVRQLLEPPQLSGPAGAALRSLSRQALVTLLVLLVLAAAWSALAPMAGAVVSPPVRVDRVIGDGETVALGGATLTAHMTPGHTPGCTSWSWRARGGDGVERTIFLHCSATVAGQTLVPESYPGMVADFRRTFERVRTIQADVFLANHPEFMAMEALRARQSAGEANAFVDPAALGRFNERLAQAFEVELARQMGR